MATTAPDRIVTLDIVRGVAVMGILFMNITGFAMPEPAYMNPRAFGGAQGLDLAVYVADFILVDGKMRGLFSLLFGASLLLVVERAEAGGLDPARVHYSRMVWLLVFGLVHLWAIWWGDILTLYAVIGMIAYAFRGRSPERLISAAATLILIQWAIAATVPLGIDATARALREAAADPGAQQAWDSMVRGFGVPPASWTEARLALMRGGYGPIALDRLRAHFTTPVTSAIFVGPETLGYMLLGMAALKSGFLGGEWPAARYRRVALAGFAIGIAGYGAIAVWLMASDYTMRAVAMGVIALTVPLRPPMIAGWAALIILAVRPGGTLATRIAATGRMAFTNYLCTSLICTTLFYGYGFGWFGRVTRAELLVVVIAVCAAMLGWSKPWLARFRYGPLEWLWRSAARGRAQPMRGEA
ncbi:DUF418 domain-containing protein [Stakelama saccharophila]|uniref:DUF418 domain-containing protein n=1 Tax=Stakelama saccharophila TaxID=3075605 RepID=A0ABZ0BC15_9SPHN|nr:DUF418 domain-containing protein [Stakelama sp. W311]WNO54898.1 DUF418 domain-containing protein [Stakelama sp. W311]